MHVELLHWTSCPEQLAATAARVCYQDVSAIELRESLSPEEIDHLLDVIISSGHLSVMEHVSFTFSIDDISRVISHQLVRHRVGIAISQQSQRYANVEGAGFVTPPSIAGTPLAESFAATMDANRRLYRELVDNGIPNEDARYVLPQAIETRLVVTINMRELQHMYSLDACLRSQWEMRHLLNSMKREVKRVSPRLARELKIKCFRSGYCDEAHMCTELEGLMPRREDVVRRSERRNAVDYSSLEQTVDP